MKSHPRPSLRVQPPDPPLFLGGTSFACPAPCSRPFRFQPIDFRQERLSRLWVFYFRADVLI